MVELKFSNMFYLTMSEIHVEMLVPDNTNRPWYRKIPWRLQEYTIWRRVIHREKNRNTVSTVG